MKNDFYPSFLASSSPARPCRRHRCVRCIASSLLLRTSRRVVDVAPSLPLLSLRAPRGVVVVASGGSGHGYSGAPSLSLLRVSRHVWWHRYHMHSGAGCRCCRCRLRGCVCRMASSSRLVARAQRCQCAVAVVAARVASRLVAPAQLGTVVLSTWHHPRRSSPSAKSPLGGLAV